VKPGKEKSDYVSKFRPISLLNTGGKVLDKLLINRINHHVFAHDIINKNQYGFTPQRSTTDAAMAVMDIFTDSRVTLDLLQNANNHSYLIEEIRKRLSNLVRASWTIGISWVKAHAGINGNEMFDQLAKAANRNSDIAVSFNRIPTNTLYSEL